MSKLNIKMLKDMMNIATTKSNNIHTHSACAMNGKRLVTPYLPNTNRTCLMKNVVGSVHAEMAVINYIVNNFFSGDEKQCLLRNTK